MADPAKGFVVTFDHTIHDEDVEHYVNLLKLIKGVVSVVPVTDEGRSDVINRERIRSEIELAIYRLFEEMRK
jgi:hypothetical protein